MNRHHDFAAVHNFRDLGGYPAADGRTVRWGRVYRSDSLGKLRGADRERFRALGVRTVIDLRYPWEIERSGRVPELPGLAFHNLSIEHRPYDQAAQGPEVEVGPFLAEKFSEVAHDGTAEIRRALEVIAHGDGPLVFHCQSGKDRTGLIAMLLLTLLGVDQEVVVSDFTLTNLATDRLVADWHQKYPELTLRWPGYGRAPAEVLELFIAELTQRYGSVRGYATERLGVDDALVAVLRERYLEG
ncbi:tyrosine-protein phosphatase [Kitasatospora viridis]|uniref:Protein-tyrosine phosphatase n=1 Tax=Kitasatospora viridis TaxID=281105 RepID=A0A561UGN8_9ACTN|nr:tyrosine-protein phosphatase [Kitasatospora viridis]TWF98516.1 protein-tyrosine phosphatase [Kitasatospora viridis]